MFPALSPVFLFDWAFVCFGACLVVHYFAVYSGLGSYTKTTTASATTTLADYACIIIPCPFHCRSFRNNVKSAATFYIFKVIPQYCTAHLLLRTISHAISARALENGGFFFTAGPRHRSKSSLLRKRVW